MAMIPTNNDDIVNSGAPETASPETIIELADRLMLDLDVIRCDCGAPYKESDAYDSAVALVRAIKAPAPAPQTPAQPIQGVWEVHVRHDVTGYPSFVIHGLAGDQKADMEMLEATARLIEVAPVLAADRLRLHADLDQLRAENERLRRILVGDGLDPDMPIPPGLNLQLKRAEADLASLRSSRETEQRQAFEEGYTDGWNDATRPPGKAFFQRHERLVAYQQRQPLEDGQA